MGKGKRPAAGKPAAKQPAARRPKAGRPKAGKPGATAIRRARATRDLAAETRRARAAKYDLRLYVAGTSRISAAAIRSITEICQTYLKGRYRLRIIDIYQQPTLARGEQIIAAPTLIKKLPFPLRRLIGNLADAQQVLVGLDLRTLP